MYCSLFYQASILGWLLGEASAGLRSRLADACPAPFPSPIHEAASSSVFDTIPTNTHRREQKEKTPETVDLNDDLNGLDVRSGIKLLRI